MPPPPKTYRYDSSLDPTLSWDENAARELAEWLIELIAAAGEKGEHEVFGTPQEWKGGGVRVASSKEAASVLRRLSKPFLNWAGKAERHQISVPTVPLSVHEKHSTQAILEGIRSRRARGTHLGFSNEAPVDINERLDAYQHPGAWHNRMILGDSLQVMSSLLELEGLGTQVQMIYFDPPYGVKYGSNFQPFVADRSVSAADDADMTREPEMVRAYRDTWELGLHSYLTYLRDRLLLARDLLHASGAIFVQICAENLHHVREVMDEVFGAENAVSLITFRKKTMQFGAKYLEGMSDYLLFYARHKESLKYRQLFVEQSVEGVPNWNYVRLPTGEERRLTPEEWAKHSLLPAGSKVFRPVLMRPSGFSASLVYDVEFEGKVYKPAKNGCWSTTQAGMQSLIAKDRVFAAGDNLYYKLFHEDYPVSSLTNLWSDTSGPKDIVYAVQTLDTVVERCLLMTTDPGDLVFDPTCGSGTTAHVAELWGRRWITCDTSRVPLALARQRLLTDAYPYFELKQPEQGPQGGFVYKRKQNARGEEVGGLVPHITLKSIANDEPPATEVLVNRPERVRNITRVAGPFVVEATIAPAMTPDFSTMGSDPSTHIERMLQVLRQSRMLRLPENQSLVLNQIRRLSDSEYLHAEAALADNGQRIAIVFGPEDGAVSSNTVYNAASEALLLEYTQLYFFGFAIQAKARELLEDRKRLRISCAYVAVTPDVALSDLLKTSRASEIFSVTGLPDFEVKATGKSHQPGEPLYQVTLAGLDIFDPATLKTQSIDGHSVPVWMLDTDYDGLAFHATQVFFPRTSAWDNLRKSLQATFDASVWAHLAGTTSEPFALGDRRRVAVKVIDDRGNELMRVADVK